MRWVRSRSACASLVACLSLPSTAGVALAAEPAMPNPFEALGQDTLSLLQGTNLLYYGAAVVSLAALSPTGGDHAVRVGVQEHIQAPLWGDTAYYAGYLLPVIVAPALYVGGLVARDRGVAGAGSAALLALGVTVTTTVVLKVGTGRPFPRHGEAADAPDRLDHPEYAREFAPFGLAGRFAWPSGHTSAAFALASSLTSYAKGSPWVAFTAYPIAVGIGTGMIVGDHHWASDVLSGAAIGQAIGWTIGGNFRERARCLPASGEVAPCSASSPPAGRTIVASWTLVPWMGEARGLAVTGALW